MNRQTHRKAVLTDFMISEHCSSELIPQPVFECPFQIKLRVTIKHKLYIFQCFIENQCFHHNLLRSSQSAAGHS